MRVFILDDDEERHRKFARHYFQHSCTHVRTADEAIDTLMREPEFDIVQLDHDLGGQQMVASDANTGWQVAKAIAEMAGVKRHGRIIVHSFNPYGAINMMRELVDKGMCVEYRPFGKWNP